MPVDKLIVCFLLEYSGYAIVKNCSVTLPFYNSTIITYSFQACRF